MKKIRKQRKRKSLVAKFFLIVFLILMIYFVAFGAYIIYTYFNGNEDDDYFKVNSNPILNLLPEVPERTNVLLIGVDADLTRTDTIMVASFNSVSKEMSIVSVPRDTLVKIPEDRWEVMCENIPQLNPNGTREMKINAIHHYGGDDGIEFLELQLEEMLDISIDYYARVNCEGFRYIVDSIGGIEYDVPMRMKYSDPTQNLKIDLQPGLQVLDGDKAEQLVRYRKGYVRQDLDRAETQQDFLKVFISTVLSKDNIKSNPTAYINTINKYVDTNFGVTDAVKYVKYISDVNSSNIKGYTLPGSAQYIGDGSYYVLDEDLTEEMVYDIFKKPAHEQNEEVKKETSFDKEIEILNGGYTSGLAGKKQDMLQDLGYNVANIGDHNGSKTEHTKIYVKKDGQGEDLVQYFHNAKIMVDEEKTEDYDIVIVLGTEETEEMPEKQSESNSSEKE